MRTHALIAIVLAACGTPSAPPRTVSRAAPTAGPFDAVHERTPAPRRWVRSWEITADEPPAFDEICEAMPLGDVSRSPLQRHMIGGKNIPGGFVVYLDPNAVRTEGLFPALRCHRAWMMLTDHAMEDCPLALTGIRVLAYGDSTELSVELTARNPVLVSELQRRAAKDLEAAASEDPNDCDDY
jgi:hypothetical protein